MSVEECLIFYVNWMQFAWVQEKKPPKQKSHPQIP